VQRGDKRESRGWGAKENGFIWGFPGTMTAEKSNSGASRAHRGNKTDNQQPGGTINGPKGIQKSLQSPGGGGGAKDRGIGLFS